jgi:hypothetical protein
MSCMCCRAGETQALIAGLGEKIDALDAKLTALIKRRACDLQNTVARVHNTANHVQRLLLMPDGTRPGGPTRLARPNPAEGCCCNKIRTAAH